MQSCDCVAGLRRSLVNTLRRFSERPNGQSDKRAEETLCEPKPHAEVGQRRQDYIHRLGIQTKNKGFNSFPGMAMPVEAPADVPAEAPGQLESTEHVVESAAEGDMTMTYLDLKSKDDFRVNFLRKLSYERVWVPQSQRAPKHQTVIIFDWDDTLLCTSFLNLRQEETLPPIVERHLKGIETAAIRILEIAMRMGSTFIITNAMNGWVEYSAAKYVPLLLPILQKVRVISARSKYESQHPTEVAQWKIQAFLEVQRQLDSEIITNLISLGDSNFEMEAVHIMGREFEQALVKTIKFRESPTPEELLKQLDLVSQKFARIVENARNLKIGLERK